jgi:hypothetical protein
MHYIVYGFTAFFLFLLLSAAQAAEAPDKSEILRVLDYYDHGTASGAILVDSKLCQDVYREGPEKNNCSEVMADNTLVAGEPGYLWLQLLVPSETEADKVLLQFEHNGVTRKVKELTIRGAFRYRTWTKTSLDKPGPWKVHILEDRGESVNKLGAVELNVVAAGVEKAARAD